VFLNIREERKSFTFGFRMYDDENQVYDNTWEEIPKTDLEILKKVATGCSNEVSDMLDFVMENKTGIYIDDAWYEWHEIKNILKT